MNRIHNLIKSTFLFIFLPVCLISLNGEGEQITIPLSTPGKAGHLIVDHYKGSITVTGYDGDVVVVNATLRYKTQSSVANGLKRIDTQSIQLSAKEKNNEIRVESNSLNKTIDLDIMVPYAFSLNLHNYDNGKITVSNVKGELEISNINGDIIVTKHSGSAILNTIDGHIIVNFKNVTANIPMVFTSVEGKIDVTFPSSVNARLKMKSDNGEIFTDFPITADRREQKTERSPKTGNRVFIDEWTYGTINNGGPEYLFKSFNGNIYIRQN